MTRARFAFAHVSEALNFLSSVLEPHTSDRWKAVGAVGLSLLTKPRVAIGGPDQWFRTPEVQRLLSLHGAEPVPTAEACDGDWTDVLELHRKAVLAQLPAARACEQFLVVPVTDERRCHYDLLDALGGLRGFQARVWSVNLSDLGDRRVFVLESKSEGAEPPHWLPGAPAIVGDYCGRWVFTPIGREHPFGDRWARLFPPGLVDEPLLWLPSLDAAPVVRRLKSRMQPQPILSTLDVTFASAPRSVPSVTLSDVDSIPIEVVAGPPRPIDDERPVAACVYRLRTARSQVGMELLRLMDLDEAGIYDLQYFNRAITPSRFSDVEHFLLQEGIALAQDDAFPHLERFDSPVALDDLGLRVFFSHRCRVRPDVSQLVEQLSSDDELLKRLRQSLHVDDVPDAIVLVESGDVPRAPIITLLAGGQPLRDVVAPLLRTWDSVPAERALTAQFPKHDERRADLARAWMACGDADAAEIVRQSGEFADWARQEVARTIAQIKTFEDRLQACAEFAVEGSRLVSAAPTDLQKLAADTVRLIDSLAQPRRAWLLSVEQRESALQTAADTAQQLGVNAVAKAAAAQRESQRLVAMLRNRQNELAEALKQMDAALGELQRANTEVERDLPTTLKRIAEGRVALAKLCVAIQTRSGEATTARQELDLETERVKTFETQVESDEAENAKLKARNKSDRAAAEARLRRAEGERARLEHVRDVEIPKAQIDADHLEAELGALRARGMEGECASLHEKLSVRRHERDHLKHLETETESKRTEIGRLREEIAALKTRAIEPKHDAATAELRAMTSGLEELRSQIAALTPSTSDVERKFDEARRELERVREKLGISWWRGVLPRRQGP